MSRSRLPSCQSDIFSESESEFRGRSRYSLRPRAGSIVQADLGQDDSFVRDTQMTKANRTRRIDVLKAKRAAKAEEVSRAKAASQENQLIVHSVSDQPVLPPSETSDTPPMSPTDVAENDGCRGLRVEELLGQIGARLAEVETISSRHSRAMRKTNLVMDGLQQQNREVAQLVMKIDDQTKRICEIEEHLSSLHGFQAAAHLFNVRLEKIEAFLEHKGHSNEGDFHETSAQRCFDQDSARGRCLCNSLNTSTKRPCKLPAETCPYPQHRKPNVAKAKTNEACLAKTKMGGQCQNNLFSCPHIGHQKHREMRIAELEQGARMADVN
ncbi:hypothetical protein AC1031_017178 [Aphanomyces cochlioides]|nr:hypothetical protein AC1031_017178 [Aphanomyces cochlioides]